MNKKISGLLAVFTAIVMLTGCTSSNTGNTNNDVQNNVESSTSISYEKNEDGMITVTHALGTTVLPEKPQHITTIGWCNQDVALALGVAPVGMSKMNFAVDETGVFPWTREKFEELDVENPVVFDDVDGLDFEAIADTNPDVILAGYSGITKEEYDRLSEIAPVIAYQDGPWISTWRDQTLINAEGMGMKSEAEKLITETESLIKEKLAKYPAIEGKSVAFCWFSADDLGSFYIYTNNDPRAAYLNDLGMVMPDSVKNAITDDSAFSISLSAENADQFKDVDMIVTYGDEALLKAMQADERISAIPAVANGAVVLLDSNHVIAASSTPSILSIPYMIDDYLALFNEAAQKVK